MSDQHVAATDRGLSTADLASAVPDQEHRDDTERPLGNGREDLADETRDDFAGETRDDVTDETREGEFDDTREGAADDLHGELPEDVEDEDLAVQDEAPAARDEAPATQDTAPAVQQDVADDAAPQLFAGDMVTGYRDRWQGIQIGFVDDPRRAVKDADELVAAVISSLATTFAEHKSELEAQWRQGEPATEELRVALRRYRSFFDQLLPR